MFDRKTRFRLLAGFTLIEMIGVIAVISILAAVILPNVIGTVFRARKDAETQNLEEIAHGLEAYITETKIIPGANWAAVIAPIIDSSLAEVTQTDSENNRFYIWDINGVPGLPYAQTPGAIPAVAQNQRVIIVSHIKQPVPVIGASGGVATATFNALWTWDGAGPVGLPFDLTSDQADGLKVKKINLSDQFFQIALRNNSVLVEGSVSLVDPKADDVLYSPYTAHAQDFLTIANPSIPTLRLLNYWYNLVGVKKAGTNETLTLNINMPGNAVQINAPTNLGGQQLLTKPNAGNPANPYNVVFAIGANPIRGDFGWTITGAGNSVIGHVYSKAELACIPTYDLDGSGARINITGPITPPTLINLFLLRNTNLELFDCSGNELHSISVVQPDSYWFSPGPPSTWGR